MCTINKKTTVRLVSTNTYPYLPVAIARYARVCTRRDLMTTDVREDCDLSRDLVERGHGSVFEHCVFTFDISGISRVCSHQIVRHRIASYTQESQRRTEPQDFVMPPGLSSEQETQMMTQYSESLCTYNELLESGMSKEDARFVLPQSVTTRLIMTMNLRELWHFWELRLHESAQWEIRHVALGAYLCIEAYYDTDVYYRNQMDCVMPKTVRRLVQKARKDISKYATIDVESNIYHRARVQIKW